MKKKHVTEIIKTKRAFVDYGLEIIYTLYRTDAERAYYSLKISENNGSVANVEDITGNPKTAELIFDKVSDGKVTPCCAFEVMEDLLEAIL